MTMDDAKEWDAHRAHVNIVTERFLENADHSELSPLDIADVASELRERYRAVMKGATLDSALQRFPDSAAAVELVAAVLRLSLEPVPEFEEDTRHDRIRGTIHGVTSEARTRAMVVCTALMRVAEECRQLVLAIKDEEGDPDVAGGSATVLPDGWLVVEMNGEPVARVPFNPTRPAEEAEQLAADMLGEHVVIHPQGTAEVHEVLGGVFDRPDSPNGTAMRVAVPRASDNR